MKKILFPILIITTLISSCSPPQVEENKATEKQNVIAQSIGTSLPSGEYTKGSISGTITLENETTELDGAYIYLEGLSYMATSSSTGTYKLDNIPTGRYTLVCYKNNYVIEKRPNILIEGGKVNIMDAINLKLNSLNIITTIPESGSQHVSISPELTFNLNKAVTHDSLMTAKLKIEGGGKVHYIDTEKPFSPPNELRYDPYELKLDFATDYTMTIEGIRGFDGSIMDGPKVVNFRTHSGGPKVVSIVPANNSYDVPVDSKVVIRFDRAMNPATINNYNIGLRTSSNSNNIHKVSVSYDPVKNEATITPIFPLNGRIYYSVSLSEQYIKDINGISMNESPNHSYTSHSFMTAHNDITHKLGSWIELMASNNGGTSYITFDTTAGKTYEVTWDDLSDGTKKYSIDTDISLYYQKNGWSRTYIPLTGGGYSTPGTFKATKTEKIYLEYSPARGHDDGLFALKVREIQ